MMFFSYEIFRQIKPTFLAIRLGNFFYFILILFGTGWLISLYDLKIARGLALLLAILSYIGIIVYGRELFSFGVTDIVISLYALYGFIALKYEKYIIAGILFAFALTCKLLPGLFFSIILFAWTIKKGVGRKFIMPHLITISVILLPFILWHPRGFLSSTILYYLSYHAGGDSTSLYFFLPSLIKPVFQYAGAFAVLFILIYGIRNHKPCVSHPLGLSFVSYIIFTAFNKMIHLNYIWGIYCLGCTALIIRMFAKKDEVMRDV